VFIDDGFGDGRCVGGHDWAIVEVETAFNFSDPRVRPICLPPAQVPIQEAVTVVSWGRKDSE
jgi:hypothetical protein